MLAGSGLWVHQFEAYVPLAGHTEEDVRDVFDNDELLSDLASLAIGWYTCPGDDCGEYI